MKVPCICPPEKVDPLCRVHASEDAGGREPGVYCSKCGGQLMSGEAVFHGLRFRGIECPPCSPAPSAAGPGAEDFEIVDAWVDRADSPICGTDREVLERILAAAREVERLQGEVAELKRQADLMAPDLLVTADRLATAEAALTRLGKYEALTEGGYMVDPADSASREIRARVEFARAYFDREPDTDREDENG